MITLREATADDRPSLAHLLRLTDAHYYNRQMEEAEYAKVLDDLLTSGFMRVVLAFEGEAPIGYAIYTLMQPTDGIGAQMFMKELFVAPEGRGKGIGSLLMRRMGEIAKARGCLRLDWVADGDNARGQAFYDRLGATRLEGRVYYRVTDFEDFLSRFE
ncbi:MAG: GNAT family N-acetyltransferase [Pseudomonadota bacterium]